MFDNTTVGWQRRKNDYIREITNVPYITSRVNGQRIQWLGHTMTNKKPMVRLGWQLKTDQQEEVGLKTMDGWSASKSID